MFRVLSDGSSPPVQVNDPLPSGSYFDYFAITPNSSRVVYWADRQTDEVYELYSVPLAGGSAPVKLNGTLIANGDVQTDFQISPDSSRVVYYGDQDTDAVRELYSVALTGGAAPVKLNGPMVSGGEAFGYFPFSPDSSQVFYYADQETDDLVEIFVTYEAPLYYQTNIILAAALSYFLIQPTSLIIT